jgi:polyketide cyclase/dehydrase/lipid transport protein
MVDVRVERVIQRPRAEVAAYAIDPGNAPEWYENIKTVDWQPPLAIGSELAFAATFLGRRLEYVYVVRELVPHERLVMSTAHGPFPMETTYAFADHDEESTRMTLRNRGEPAGFKRMAAPMLARMMRRANEADLRRLQSILEQR